MYTRIHLKQKFDCTCCLKIFSSLLKLKRHQLLHTGMNYSRHHHNNGIALGKKLPLKTEKNPFYSLDKLFNCFLCSKYFHTIGDKKNHINSHCGTKFLFRENSVSVCGLNNLIMYKFNQKLMLNGDCHVINA